jgi:signal transduction histidine kinase
MQPDENSQLDIHLLSNFVHQIINPLNGVIGTIDNIIDGTTSSEKQDQRLRVVRAQLEWSVVLIRNLAFFAQKAVTSEASSERDLTKICVIPQLVIEATQFFQESGLSKDVKIHLMDRATQYAVKGSPDLLRQVFMNLIDNGVKYSKRNSTIQINTRIQKKTNHLIVDIINHGPGFTSDEAKRIFEPGFRGDEAKNLVASGTGLGLYICKLIVEEIHASIEASHSPTTNTTTMMLRFPEWKIA